MRGEDCCDPFHNKLLCHGPRSGKIDAGKLCEMLRAGLLKEVNHSDHGLYELRPLVRAYRDVVCAGVRALNQNKALTLGHRDKGKSASFDPGACFVLAPVDFQRLSPLT